MKKSDIQILNRVLRENKKSRPGLMGSIAGKNCNYYMNMYMILASSEAAEGIEPARDTWDCGKMFDETYNMDLIDVDIDMEALQAHKKEGKKLGNGSKAPYIIKVNDGGKIIYIGINPAFLLDLLKFTGTDYIMINAAGLKEGYYKLPFYAGGAGRKGLCLPVNVNPRNADKTPEVNQEVDILRATNKKPAAVKTEAKEAAADVKQEAAPEVKPEAIETPEVKAPAADDPAYLLAVWYAENILLKQKTA